MSRPLTLHRPSAILAAFAISICVLFGYWAFKALGLIPVATRTERLGLFEITYTTLDAFGHRGTTRALHYRGATGRILVARNIGTFEVNPNEPSGILFERCPNGDQPECGIHYFYFDGQRPRSWKVSDEQVLHQAAVGAVSWSPDRRFVVLTGHHNLEIVPLDKPGTIDMREALDVSEGGRSVRFGEWSPDSRRISVLVSQYIDPVPPFVSVAEDLVVIDVHDGSARYVATSRPHGWRSLSQQWLQTADGYALYVTPAPLGAEQIYRKEPADLPAGILPQ